MSPHSDPRRNMHQLEMTRFRHPLLTVVSVVDDDLEMSVELFLFSFLITRRGSVPSRELGVRGESGTGDVVSEESRVREDMSKGDYIVLSNYSSSSVQR